MSHQHGNGFKRDKGHLAPGHYIGPGGLYNLATHTTTSLYGNDLYNWCRCHSLMRILLIAPATDLPFAPAEVAAVANTPGHTVHQMQGEVNRRDLVAEATRQDVRYDVLWFATHGSRDGVLMSDGLIGIASLAPLEIGRAHV